MAPSRPRPARAIGCVACCERDSEIGHGYIIPDRIYGRFNKVPPAGGFLVPCGGHNCAGEYTEEFRTQEEANKLLQSLERGPFYVRYNPVSPSDYVVDPYRDVWFPDIEQAGPSAEVQVSHPKRINFISLGQLAIIQVGLVILLFKAPKPAHVTFWFLAAAHAIGAFTIQRCCWWNPRGKPMPTWVGRSALLLTAGGWVLMARFLR